MHTTKVFIPRPQPGKGGSRGRCRVRPANPRFPARQWKRPRCVACTGSEARSTVQVIILGSGSPLPDPGRAGPSTLVRTTAGDLLFDCGRGVLMRAAAAGSGAGMFRALCLTHLHSDHISDLNDIFTTR